MTVIWRNGENVYFQIEVMGTYFYERLRAQAIAKGELRCIYEPIGEQLPDRSVWESLPDFYKAHVEEKNEKVRRLCEQIPNRETFVFFADSHVRQNRMLCVPIVCSILENTPIEKVIYGGDTVSAWVNDETMVEDVKFFADAFDFAKPYMVRGNHDVYGKEFWIANEGGTLPSTEVYDLIMAKDADRVCGEAGKTYYYFDREETKTRYIVIDTNERLTPFCDEDGLWDCTVRVSRDQIAWFISTLTGMKDGYDAVVVGHIPFFKELRHSAPEAQVFGDLIRAFNEKRVFSGSVSIGGGEEYSEQVDFTATKGRVIATFTGHGHIDDSFVLPDGCVNIEIHCDAPGTDNGGSPYKKSYGTVNENALDAVIIDRDF